MKNGFDTITIRLPRPSITEYDSSYFKSTAFDRNTGELYNDKTTDLTESGFTGLNWIKLTPEHCDIDLSAKILGSDYPKGITDETYPAVFNYINNSGVIRVSESDFYHLSRFLKCHTANNLVLTEKPLSDYLTALQLFRRPQIGITPYSTKKNEGLVFKKGKFHVKVYNKLLDMQRPANRDFLKSHPEMFVQLDKILRFESEHVKFAHMKERFDVKTLNWKSMLSSTKNVNAIMFDKIIKEVDTTQTLHSFKRIPAGRDYHYYENVLLFKCDNDLAKVKKYLNAIYSDESISRQNINREFNKISQFKLQLESDQLQATGINTSELVKEIKSKLSQ